MRTKELVALASAFFIPSIVLSVVITINQVAILPNRPDTTYYLHRDASTGSRITVAQLLLTGSTVNSVSISYVISPGQGGNYVRQVSLYNADGVLVASSSNVCGNRAPGTYIETLAVSPAVSVDSVASVRTCLRRVVTCPATC
ncbi:MAG: hypothetical protein QXY54_01155 [Nitrososphaerota archaeon]